MAKRKMSPEQKAAAVERLAKAREKRLKENPPQYKNIDPSVLARGEDDPFYFRKVQGWIKTQKELLSSARQSLRKKEKGAESRVANHQAYIRNLETYYEVVTMLTTSMVKWVNIKSSGDVLHLHTMQKGWLRDPMESSIMI